MSIVTNLLKQIYYEPLSEASQSSVSERTREINVISSRCPRAFLWVWVGEASGLTKSRKLNGKYIMGEKGWVTHRKLK